MANLILSTSLSPHSKSAVMAQAAFTLTKSFGLLYDLIDLRDHPLPFCNGHGGSAYDDPTVKQLHDRIEQASAIVIMGPIYNYQVAASTKNLIELTSHPHLPLLSGDAWRHKRVGYMGFSGTERSMLAPMSFLSGLFIDLHVTLVAPLVMASFGDFQSDAPSDALKDRMTTLLKNLG